MSNTPLFSLTPEDIRKLKQPSYRGCTITVLFPGGLCRVFQNTHDGEGVREITHLLVGKELPGITRQSTGSVIYIPFIDWVGLFGSEEHAFNKLEPLEVEDLANATTVLVIKDYRKEGVSGTEIPDRVH